MFKARERSRCKGCTAVQMPGPKGIKEEVEVSDYSPERGFPRWGTKVAGKDANHPQFKEE